MSWYDLVYTKCLETWQEDTIHMWREVVKRYKNMNAPLICPTQFGTTVRKCLKDTLAPTQKVGHFCTTDIVLNCLRSEMSWSDVSVHQCFRYRLTIHRPYRPMGHIGPNIVGPQYWGLYGPNIVAPKCVAPRCVVPRCVAPFGAPRHPAPLHNIGASIFFFLSNIILHCVSKKSMWLRLRR